jgi:hypothetical protein
MTAAMAAAPTSHQPVISSMALRPHALAPKAGTRATSSFLVHGLAGCLGPAVFAALPRRAFAGAEADVPQDCCSVPGIWPLPPQPKQVFCWRLEPLPEPPQAAQAMLVKPPVPLPLQL